MSTNSTAVPSNIRKALRAQLLTVAGLPEVQNHAQLDGDVDFKPIIGEPWWRETMLRQPGRPQRASLGQQALMRHTAGWQISLFFPPNDDADVGPIETLGGGIQLAFEDGVELTYAGQVVRILGCGLGTVVSDKVNGTWWSHLPCRVQWQADVFNVQ